MKNKNSNVLDMFISCKEDLNLNMNMKNMDINKNKNKNTVKNHKTCIYDDLSDFERANNYWNNKVDKVLREMILRTLRTSSELRTIVKLFEELLSKIINFSNNLNNIDNNSNSDINNNILIPIILNNTCTTPITYKINKKSIVLSCAFKKEHSLLRVFLHGICQYHGIKSQVNRKLYN